MTPAQDDQVIGKIWISTLMRVQNLYLHWPGVSKKNYIFIANEHKATFCSSVYLQFD